MNLFFLLLLFINISKFPASLRPSSDDERKTFFFLKADFFNGTSEDRGNEGEVARQMGSLVAIMNAPVRGKIKNLQIKAGFPGESL